MDVNHSRAPNASLYLWIGNALLLLTVYGSLIPLRYQEVPLQQALDRFRHIPFEDPRLTGARGDWVVNMVQYGTVSFCYVAAWGLDRGRARSLVPAAMVVPVGWAVAVALEFLQIYFPPRTVSLNDILVECLGVLGGAGAWLLAGQQFTEWLRRFWGLRGLPGLATQLLPGYLGLLAVVYLMPFDVVIGREELADKYFQGRIDLVPFASLAAGGVGPLLKLLTNTVAFLPLGMLLALAPRWSGCGWRTILLLGLAVTAPVRLAQIFVYTRSFDVTDILTGTAAVLVGWWLVQALRDPRAAQRLGAGGEAPLWSAAQRCVHAWGPAPWILLALTWALVVTLIYWQPYHFTTDPADFVHSDAEMSDEDTSVVGLRRMSWAPFADYYWGSRYNALDQIVRRSLCFAPLGVLLAVAFGRRERLGEAVTALAALAFATFLAAGQYFIPERHPSVTSVLIEAAGAWLGYGLARHAARALGPIQEGRGPQRDPSRAASGPRPRSAAPPPGRTGHVPHVAAVAEPPQRLGELLDVAIDWLKSRPLWVRVLFLCVTASVLSVGFVLVLGAAGVL